MIWAKRINRIFGIDIQTGTAASDRRDAGAAILADLSRLRPQLVASL
jgi:hypothetical protein